VGEHVGRGLAERLASAGHLERDRRDGTGVGVVGLPQGDRGRRERRLDPAEDVLGRRDEDVEQLGVEHPRVPDDLLAQLFLAAGEEVVQRAERRLRLGDDLFEPGAGVAVAAEQLGAGGHDPFSGVAHRPSLR
jgi:hypothetical protein